MRTIEFIIEILKIIEDGEYEFFWYIDDKEEAAKYILNKMDE